MGIASFAVEVVVIVVGFALKVDLGGELTEFDKSFDQFAGLTRLGVGQWAPGCLLAPLTQTGLNLQQHPVGWLR